MTSVEHAIIRVGLDRSRDVMVKLCVRISDVAELRAKASPNQIALVESTAKWTYRELNSAIGHMQSFLSVQGVRAGDRVMIVGENCRTFVTVLLALSRLDAWPVLVNARLSTREIDEIRDHCGARLMVFLTHVSHHAREHATRHNAAKVDVEVCGPLSIAPLNENAQPEPLEEEIGDRVAVVIYTSGTTGTPKGVMLTHRNLLFVAAESANIRSLNADDRMYGVLPMSHAVGLSVVLLGSLLSGAVVYLSARFDPVAVLKALEKDEITVMLGAPAMFSLLLEYIKFKEIKSLHLPALRIISSSSAPLHLALKSEVEKIFGLVLHNGYGVTECSPNVAQTRIEAPRKDTSAGPVFPGVEIKLVGPNRETVAEGEIGELWVRGPNIMKGYYHAPEETANTVDADGWFNTRDMARIEDGNISIVGRNKDMIVRFGLNVYPAEVESVLHTHPDVVHVAVMGRQVKGVEGDEEVVAFVQARTDSRLTADELATHAGLRLAPYKRPSRIMFMPSLPLTPTGKVVKTELAKIAGFQSRPN